MMLLAPLFMLAQNYAYDWEEGRTEVHELNKFEAASNAVVILDNRIIEYVESVQGYEMVVTRHKIIRVNDDRGIDEFNKVFVPMNGVSDVIMLKARAISKDGKVTELDEESIKSLENYEDYGSFKLFAIEGAGKGGEIEYVYQLRKEIEIFGQETFQSTVKVRQAKFTLLAPRRLLFEFKNYNEFPELRMDKDGEYNIWHAETEFIPELIEEDYSAYQASKMKVAYKLEMTQPEMQPILTWNSAADHYYTVLHADYNKGSLNNLLKDAGIKKLKDNREKVVAVEDYIKKNIALKLDAGPDYSTLNGVLDKRYANELGMTRLFVAALEAMEIPFQIVVTCSRYDGKLDPDYADFNLLDEFLIYLPEYDAYISAANPEYRLGLAPNYLGGNNGLFIKDATSGTIKPIAIGGLDDNMAILDAEIIISKDLESVTVQKKQEWYGYRAIQYRGYLKYVDDDTRNEFVQEISTSGIDDAVLEKKAFEHEDISETAGKEPLELEITFSSSASLLESAGNSYLLNIGMIIGTQAELYQEQTRQTDIAFPFPNQYKHHIYFKIPDGYKVEGLDGAIIEKELEIDGEVVASFISGYEVKNGYVHINVHEFYKQVDYPKESYEEFRQVINAASDFNKLVLVLEQK